MNEQEGFLQAILANPDDDQLRLIYADWLEERADPRGEFIRVQVELAGPKPEPQRAHELFVREKELLASHEAEWVRPLGSLLHGWTFRRGFLHEVQMSCGTFLSQAPALFQAAPVKELKVSYGSHLAAEFADCPYLARLEKLTIAGKRGGALGENGLSVLARSRHLRSLLALGLPAHGVDLRSMRELAASEALAGLVTLDVTDNDIGDLGLHAILGSPHLTNLRHLLLSRCGITTSGMTSLARSAIIGQLETLALDGNFKIDNRGIRALADCRRLDSLRTLGLGWCSEINGLAIRSLAQCKQLAGLAELDLSHSPIGDTGAEALADSPHMENLTRLNLYKCHGITPTGKDRLLKRFGRRVVL